jgi:hypothetical protein
MYYEKNQVNEILLCQNCQAQLEGPKSQQKHEMPKNGLPDNKVVSKMVSIKPTKVSRGKAVDLLEESLVEILKKQKNIKKRIENSIDLVKEYCINLRSDIQLKTEEAIQQINDISSEIIDQIDKYEKELIEFNKVNSKSLDEYNKVSKELEEFHSINTELLSKNNIDERLVIRSNKKAARLIKESDLEIQDLNDIIFDGKLLTFEKNSNKINK